MLAPGVLEAVQRLRQAGHEAYVVGGAVRDLLLGRGPPVDYDLLTSAHPRAARALLPRAALVGARHPVVRAEVGGTKLDVSSLDTGAGPRGAPRDASALLQLGGGGGGAVAAAAATARGLEHGAIPPPAGDGWGTSWAEARRSNAAGRDFTVNALLWDPLPNLLFDAVGGLADLRARRLRACGEPAASFADDAARVLRGVRVAARAGLAVEASTEAAMRAAAGGVAALPAARLRLEADCLLAYGAAAPSVLLLRRLGLLRVLLPRHVALLDGCGWAGGSGSSGSGTGVDSGSSSGGGGGVEDGALLRALRELDARASTARRAPPEVVAALLVAPLAQERLRALRAQAQPRQDQGATPRQQEQRQQQQLRPRQQQPPKGQEQGQWEQQQEPRWWPAQLASGLHEVAVGAAVHGAVWDTAEELALSSCSCFTPRQLHHAAPLLLKHWRLCRLRRRVRAGPGPGGGEEAGPPQGALQQQHQQQQQGGGDDEDEDDDGWEGEAAPAPAIAPDLSPAAARMARHLLQRRDELLALRASRRAAAAALDAVSGRHTRQAALTKLERRELRDTKLRLRALGWRHGGTGGGGGGGALDHGGGSPFEGGAGAVAIGICTLEHLRRGQQAEPRGGGAAARPQQRQGGAAGGAASPARALADALAVLTPGEALVHECLLAAGIELDEAAWDGGAASGL
ncbi:MAG: hypothetical protein J3K34DRAFT_472739 [Monoraphidium minutum]|nr:MAG: hypothetical protein J3K34DRAFT_472739 [Monoraphidium minutum]